MTDDKTALFCDPCQVGWTGTPRSRCWMCRKQGRPKHLQLTSQTSPGALTWWWNHLLSGGDTTNE